MCENAQPKGVRGGIVGIGLGGGDIKRLKNGYNMMGL